jgi:hypothetical protein
MLKKVTAVLAVLLLVLGTMSIGASAVGESIGITIRADKTTNLYPGDIVTFTVNISTNFRYIAMRWPVMYTLKAFEPVIANDGNGDADYGNVIGFGALADTNSFLESAEVTTTEPFGNPYTKANYGCLLIQWTGGATGSGVANYYEPSGADCLTFQLRVKAGYTANKGVGTVAIPTTNQAKSMFYLEGITDPADAESTFKLTTDSCAITANVCTVTIIKEAAGLLPKSNTDTVVDTESGHNYIYGLNSILRDMETIDEDTIYQYLTFTGDATFELVPNDLDMISTGAVLKLYDAEGTFLADYTFVVFGDMNGDCVLDGTDISILIDGYLYMEEWSWGDLKDNATFFSCDINGDGMVGSDDLGPLSEAIGTVGYINQTNDPENFFIYF